MVQYVQFIYFESWVKKQSVTFKWRNEMKWKEKGIVLIASKTHKYRKVFYFAI